ncbi:hypothetical protein VINE108274_23010 [Vibrio neptunius]
MCRVRDEVWTKLFYSKNFHSTYIDERKYSETVAVKRYDNNLYRVIIYSE